VNVSHQYLTKPCELEILKSTILSGCALSSIIAGIDELPSLPAVYQELMEAVRSPDISMNAIGKIISRDMGMTTKILRLINSAYFGLRAEITDVPHAASLLGLAVIQSLVLGIQIFSKLDSKKIPPAFIENLWAHSMRTGTFARAIAIEEDLDRDTIGKIFVTGLLHDLGKIMLASNVPNRYREVIARVKKDRIPFTEAEQHMMGTTHTEVGTYLAGLWGLDADIIHAIAFHHNPGDSIEMTFSPLTAVHVANALDHDDASAEGESHSVIDTEYLSSVEQAHRLPFWIKACRKAASA
jgi:HD-like signal output (HDOD) protein